MAVTPYVMLSQGHVERAENAIVLDLDYLLQDAAVSQPGPVQEMEAQLAKLADEGAPVVQWVEICREWLEDHFEANPAQP